MLKGGNPTITRILNFAIAVFFIGIIFKIQHYAYAAELLLGAMLSIFIAYSIRFIQKQNKQLLDYLKVFFVQSWVVATVLRLQHYPYNRLASQIAFGALILVVLVSGIQRIKK